MGAYASAEDVRSRLDTVNVVINNDSKVTETEVNGFILQREATINGILRAQGYSTIPATGDTDVLMLRGYVADRVAAQVFSIIFRGSAEFPARVQTWIKDWDTFILMLRKGEQQLVNQSPQGEDDGGFFIVGHPSRDDYFTERYGQTDWDE